MLSNLNGEYKKKLEIIKNHFGEDAQYKKLVEEMKELEDEFIRFIKLSSSYIRNPKKEKVQNLLNELADCYVVAYQINETEYIDRIAHYYSEQYFGSRRMINHIIHVSGKDVILEIAKQKIDRTLERIESGYYDSCPDCNGEGSIRFPYGRTLTKCKKCKGTGRKEK